MISWSEFLFGSLFGPPSLPRFFFCYFFHDCVVSIDTKRVNPHSFIVDYVNFIFVKSQRRKKNRKNNFPTENVWKIKSTLKCRKVIKANSIVRIHVRLPNHIDYFWRRFNSMKRQLPFILSKRKNRGIDDIPFSTRCVTVCYDMRDNTVSSWESLK